MLIHFSTVCFMQLMPFVFITSERFMFNSVIQEFDEQQTEQNYASLILLSFSKSDPNSRGNRIEELFLKWQNKAGRTVTEFGIYRIEVFRINLTLEQSTGRNVYASRILRVIKSATGE